MPTKTDSMEGTKLDENLHRPRLKSGLVPKDTRIFLRVLKGADSGKVFDLSSGGSYIIGRGAGDIPLNDGKISSRHAEIKLLGPDGHFIHDLASTNGTFLNGARVEKGKLVNGAEIRVGDSFLQFDLIEGAIPLSRT